ncbi:ABC transporter substrate-binding protein [Bordetella genomosp. 8]|nr:ABC transporter substrate-binding protein [Bordetella genomosp. 8]
MPIAARPADAAPAAKPARPAPPPPALRIGEINTYKALPGFSEDYRRGWTLALEQVNADGGVLGRKLEVRSRDDRGNPDDAVQAAQALVDKDGVVALFGGYSSEVGLALSRYADTAKVPYLAVAPLSQRLTWQDGNRYTFRLRPGAWMQAAAVAPKALGLRRLRWALVYQDTESDRATADAFKGLIRTFQSKTEFVDEIVVPATGKFDAMAAVAALSAARPEAIFNLLTGEQLAALVRAGTAAHLFDGMGVVAPFMGDPENLDLLDETLGAAIPDGWIITGYPRDAIDTPEGQAFAQAYRDRFGAAPGMAAVLGYSALRSISEALKRAGSPDREAVAAAFPRLQVPTPFGTIEYRNLDHQSTLGIYLGYTGHVDGRVTMDRFVYATGARLQPLDEQIRRLRAQTARAPGSSTAGDAAVQPANAPETQNGARATAVPSRPVARPDTGLTTRLRGARPGTAPPVHPVVQAPAGTDGPVKAAQPGVTIHAPMMGDWPDQVDPRGNAAH